MNVFVLSRNPVEAAQQQCDKHIPKMVVESAQMLSTVHRILDGVEMLKPSVSGKRQVKYYMLPDDRELTLYKAVHHKHPCTVWTGESFINYRWHWKHFSALCDEYTHRYGKVHATDMKLREELERMPDNIPRTRMTDFKLAMQSNPECMFPEDPVKSYQKFYMTKQKRFTMKWTNRKVPEWFKYE